MSGIPRSADEVLPDESPVCGSAEEPVMVARYLAELESDLGECKLSIERTVASLETMQSLSVDAASVALRERVRVGAIALDQTALDARRAFERYASEIEDLHERARRISDHVDARLDDIRRESRAILEIGTAIGVAVDCDWQEGPQTQLPEPRALATAHDEAEAWRLRETYGLSWTISAERWRSAAQEVVLLLDEWRQLVADRKTAEIVLMRALDATAIGQLVVIAGGGAAARRESVAFGVSGELLGRRRAGVPISRRHPLLVQLIGAESGAGIWNSPPDPAMVSARWAALPAASQERLISQVPWVIGNLAGLPFAVRDRANRRLIEYYAVHHDRLSPESLAALRDLTAQLAREEHPAEGEAAPQIQVVSLDLDSRVPMLVVAFGDLDTARHATWLVPGMQSDASTALDGWAAAGTGLLAAQRQVLLAAGRAGESTAAVAFLGYDTPNLVTVLSEEPARVGALRLAAELDGSVVAQRRSGAEQGVAVIAHSYGTPTAANALSLTRYPLSSFTMLGSAGLDSDRVERIDGLRVERDAAGRPRVFSAMAAGDLLAPIGAGLSGRSQPNPEAVLLGGGAIHGAYLFAAEGDGTLLATDGHSAIGSGERGPLGVNASEGRGYLDPGTQSQWNAAAISVGAPEWISGALRTVHAEGDASREAVAGGTGRKEDG